MESLIQNQYLFIADKKGNYNLWRIYEFTEKTYLIQTRNIKKEISIDSTYKKENSNILWSSSIVEVDDSNNIEKVDIHQRCYKCQSSCLNCFFRLNNDICSIKNIDTKDIKELKNNFNCYSYANELTMRKQDDFQDDYDLSDINDEYDLNTENKNLNVYEDIEGEN
jgi:hypothetical protein